MKSILFVLLTVFFSFSYILGQDKTKEIINKIEKHLMPAVLVEGDPEVFYTINERMNYYKVPGLSIAFINDGKIEWTKTYGYTSFDTIKAIDEKTLFQAASISKPVAAMAALYLVQTGKIALDADVNSYLVGWKIEENKFTEKNKVTVARLLSHSAGLTVHGFLGYAKGETVPDIIQILKGEKPANSEGIKPDTVPGVMFRYSGGGYTVMQKIVIDLTKISFPDFMYKIVLSKIGMNNSTYIQPLPMKFHNNASIGHNAKGDTIPGKWHTYPEMAAAGLWTTPSDLAKFAIEIQKSLKEKSNKVLSKEFTKKMVTRYKSDYGLGLGISGDGDSIRFEHGGANEGYRCQLIAFTNLGMGIVLMTNSDNGSSLISEVIRSVSKVYNWNIYKPIVKKIISLDSDKLNSFVGKYQIGPDYIIEISLMENTLVMKQLWDNAEYKIYPESTNNFFERDGGANFTFEKTPEGNIKSFKVFGQYEFMKI